jgi:signal transduction histidine kinase
LEFNAAFEKSTGIPRELLIHDPAAGREEFVNRVDGFVNVDTVRAVIEKLRRCLNAGAVIEEEFAFDLPVGRRYYHASLVPLRDTSGRIYRILCIVRDISERQRMALRLEESRLLLRQLAARNEEAREDERRRLKREIHDELGQYLSALRLGISVVDIQLGKKRSPLRANTSRLIGVIDTTIKVVRDVVVALRPSALDMGIVSALEWLVAEYFDHTGISCELHIPDDDLDMDDKRATAVFRISQESLTNIARHAQATQVAISLEEMEGSYRLEVRDNGQGFDPSVRKEESFGLVGIQERALMLGGKVGISSVPGKTTIRVQFPVGSEG